MSATPSNAWFEVFPGPRIPDVLAYVVSTWDWLQQSFATAVSFDLSETDLTDNLCEALEDSNRRRANAIDCDFQAETWELRREPNGRTVRVARADIRVILGAPGTPHLVIEFKKLDGSADGRWRYCFDGINRFVEGKYATGHAFGVMCGFSPNDLAIEAASLADYISEKEYADRLCCILNADDQVITIPSQADPTWAKFDTVHERLNVGSGAPIILLHALLPCPRLRPVRTKEKTPQKRKSKSTANVSDKK